VFRPADPSSDAATRLDAFSFAAGISPRAHDTVTGQARPVDFATGAVLLDEGLNCDPLLFVERGSIRVCKRAASGREISLYSVEPGESCVLAMVGMLGRTFYPATAVVDEHLHGLALPAPVFRDVYGTEPALQQFVMDLITRRLGVLMALVAEIAFHRMDHRLARFLLAKAEKAPGLLAPVERTHEQIASELGTAREIVTRLLRSFEEKGLVEPGRGRVRVLDADGLRNWSR